MAMPSNTSSYQLAMVQPAWHQSVVYGQIPMPQPTDTFVHEDLRCGYSSKRCDNIRTSKKGGGLHRFCEFHRRRANKNQWRVDHKRRMLRSQVKKTATKSATEAARPYTAPPLSRQRPRLEVTSEMSVAETDLEIPDLLFGEECEDSGLSASDIAMLTEILFDGDELFMNVGAPPLPAVSPRSPSSMLGYAPVDIKTEAANL